MLKRILLALLAIYCVHHTSFALTLKANALQDQGVFPIIYTCDGKNISPALSWSDLPQETHSLALLLTDPDVPSGTFYHWVVYNIPSTVTSLAEAEVVGKIGAMEGINTLNKAAYFGPCPPKGETHHYIFTLYALKNKINLAENANGNTVLKALTPYIIKKATLSTTYHRPS